MSQMDIERNAEISMMRKQGATYREISEWFEIAPQRAQQICVKFSDGDTKEEIIRNYMQKQEEKEKKRLESSLEYRRMEDKRKNGREYVIMNGAEDMYLTAIEKQSGQPTVYRYGSADIHDAMWFSLEEAKKIAGERKARALWVP